MAPSAARYLWIQLTAQRSTVGCALLDLHHNPPPPNCSVRCFFPGCKSKGLAQSSMSQFPHGWRLPGVCVPLLSTHKQTLCPAVSVPVTQAPLFIRWCSATREQSDKMHSLEEVGGIFCTVTKTKKASQGSVFHPVSLFLSLCNPSHPQDLIRKRHLG